MRKTTAALTASLLGAGSAALLSVAVPGVAAASGCGDTTLDQTSFQTFFSAQDNRNGGTHTVEADTVRVYAPSGSAKASAYHPVNIPLASQTSQDNYALDASWVRGGIAPSYQLTVDLNGPAEGGFTTLVYEDIYQDANPNTWWSTSSRGAGADHPLINTGGGHGSEAWATLQAWSAEYPDAVITSFGYSLGTGPTFGEANISSITFGCNDFLFAYTNQAPTAAFVVNDNGDNDYRTYKFVNQSTDVEEGELEYLWTFGDGTTSTEESPVHRYPAGNRSYDATLTVTDAQGATHTAGPWVVNVAVPAPTVNKDNPLAGTGADVMGLAAFGGLAIAGAGAGLVINRRRKADTNA